MFPFKFKSHTGTHKFKEHLFLIAIMINYKYMYSVYIHTCIYMYPETIVDRKSNDDQMQLYTVGVNRSRVYCICIATSKQNEHIVLEEGHAHVYSL